MDPDSLTSEFTPRSLSRRALLAVAAGAVPATVFGASEADASLSWPRRPGQVIQSSVVRTHGPVMFIGDSTSAKGCDRMGRLLNAQDVGPYRVDLNLARFICVDKPLRPSAISAVRRARAEGFDGPSDMATYVVGLGFPDLIHGDALPLFIKDPIAGTAAMVEPFLEEVGADRTVSFLNVYATKSVKAARARQFNEGLAALLPKWPRLHIIDWASTARKNRWWHKWDGFHYTDKAAPYRRQFVIGAMVTGTQLRSDDDVRLAPPPPTPPPTEDPGTPSG